MARPEIDLLHMTRALRLAERGRGRTSPNPMVGAVVVDREGVVVGRGAHELAGGPHAEIHALAEAGSRARGATLYCTLEPCCHTGRTGPCAPRVVDAGIRRVVVATEDPNPLVAGKGLAHLRSHGVEVDVGVLGREAARLNGPFFTVMRQRRPFVTLKAALSLDARVAGPGGARTSLTGPAANRLIHRDRAEVDAILVGSGTILADDPLLTARGAYRSRPLVRAIFDARLRTPPGARVLSTQDRGPVIIMSTETAAAAAPDRAESLKQAGARLELLQTDVERSIPVRAALVRLAELGVTSAVLEGGPRLHDAAWQAGAIDRVQLFVSMRVLGADALPWLPLPSVSVQSLSEVRVSPVGDDVMIEGYVHGPD